jgi:hypothetical protein
MDTKPSYTRPPFAEAVAAWKAHLVQRDLPTELLWVFDENLCFEKDPAAPGGFRLGFQTLFTPPPPGAEQIAYGYFAGFDAPLVFYRLGSARGKSVCLLLCDKWFDNKGQTEGYVSWPHWRMLTRAGAAGEVEEIDERPRWERRILRDRPLHDLDFCMTLRAIHETLAHGRVLSTYERSALKVLHLWRRVFHPSNLIETRRD